MPQTDVCADAPLEGYAFAYLDETTKRMIRRGLLKAVAIPGYQVPFASREMPMPYGWGTGGVQVTASIIGPADVPVPTFPTTALHAAAALRAALPDGDGRLLHTIGR